MHIPAITELSQNRSITLFWLRRDLRLDDNHGLYQALKNHEHVLPIFIFDTSILDQLADVADRRVNFIYEQIQAMKQTLEQHKSSLGVCYGKPIDIYKKLVDTLHIQAVYTNHDYEPYARKRDQAVQDLLAAYHIPFYTFKDQVIFEKDEIVKGNGEPYTVFTPYMKKWKKTFMPKLAEGFDTPAYFRHLLRISPLPLLTLTNMGFKAHSYDFPSKEIDRGLIKQYDKQRDIPSIRGTSQLGVHLRFGTISIRVATRIAIESNEVWLNELIWRNFYMMILWHFPYVVTRSFKSIYDEVKWINDEQQFRAWCEGLTGYPIVDAGMRELNKTGYMHNRLRMITASFLTKHLLIDWRWGENFFGKKLLDYELSSNNGGWQWAAGSGCDAAPYFRVFNPVLQTQRFDADLKYIKQWNPQFQDVNYPQPIVDHNAARERAIKAYKTALRSESWHVEQNS
ncbi:MAG: deoxyribodipyrimidine photo-lyase [Bacteroidota bacterium]